MNKHESICEACEGQRWLIFSTDSDGYFVFRCDECAEGNLTDTEAVLLARKAGLDVPNLNGHVSKPEVNRWMKLYPNRGIKA